MHVLLFLRDDRQISSRTQAHTLACTVQISHVATSVHTQRLCRHAATALKLHVSIKVMYT